MSTQYRLDFYDTSGVRQAMLAPSAAADAVGAKSGFSGLAYTKVVNAPGIMAFRLRGDHELLASLADKWQVEAWRKPDGQAWSRDFVGVFRQPDWRFFDRPIFTGYCPGLMTILSWRHVLWYAGTTNRSKFTTANSETVMNTLVNYNACASATTANGRRRNGAITGLTTEADGAGGVSIDWFCSYANLLETLQECAKIGGGDFDVIKTSTTAWQWRFYVGQLGTDRSASISFSMERGNMVDVVYRIDRLEERTVVLVGGQGEESDRQYEIVTGTNYNVNTNNIESFVDAADVTTSAGLINRGTKYLYDREAREVFTFTGKNKPLTQYGVHYFLGDLVNAINPITGGSYTAKVRQVSVSFDEDGKEIIGASINTD